MPQSIPTLTIEKIINHPTQQKLDGDCYYAFETGVALAPDYPHRTSFYTIGLVVNGSIQLHADLQQYTAKKRWVFCIPPAAIRFWQEPSNDYRADTVFFTRAFLHQGQIFPPEFLERFPFFSASATYCFPVEESEAKNIEQQLQFIQKISNSNHARKEAIIRHSVGILLELITAVYSQETLPTTEGVSKPITLANKFKSLVCKHAVALRMVAHYADMLNVSPKYLTKVVKNNTGKTPGEIIDEMVTLEAQVLLANEQKRVAEVAEALQFPDASTFGKYFKKHAGFSPKAYRNNLTKSGPPPATN